MSKFFGRLFAKKMANVNIERDFYTMSTVNGYEAEIQFYGEIVKTRPVDWWTGEPEPGNFIMLDEFLEDLKSISNAKNILMRIDSLGGDSDASVTIHNRLRELKAYKTAIVDGVAMSGGSLIMSAADIIKVNLSSQVMIHKCWSYLRGAYNADELRDAARLFDAVDKQQVAIYKRKTGLKDEDILAMMAETTFLVGQEILDKGFADELLDSDEGKLEIAASADKRFLFVNGKPLHMVPFAILPKDTPTVTAAQADAIKKNKPAMPGSEGGNNLMAKNLEELRKENPELAAAVEADIKAAAAAAAAAVVPAGTSTDQGTVNTAISEERKRQQEIDEIASMVNDDELVQEAKYGEKACTAQELAFRSMKKQAQQGTQHLDNTNADYQKSQAAQVPAVPMGGKDNAQAEVDATIDAGVEAAKKAFGGK